MKLLKSILFFTIVLFILFYVYLCIKDKKYEFSIAILGLFVPFITLFFSQDFEIKKIKINNIYKRNTELYTKLSQIINKLLAVLGSLEYNRNSYIFYEKSRMFKDEQKKNGGLYYNTLSEAESNNYLHKNTIQWMKEMHKHLNSLYELYNENGISFSNCVDRQYRKIADKNWATQITTRWSNCNLYNDKKEILSCFFADYNFKDIIQLKKELEKFMRIIKNDLGV